MSEKCLKCFRPLSTCYCPYITPVETGIKFVFLMHPKEAYRQHTGTGRLAALSLSGSEIIVGIDFTQNNRLNTLLNDEQYKPLLLYPGDDAVTADDTELAQATQKGQTLLVIVVDATWFFAKKMLRLSPNVRTLPKLSFRDSYRSQFIFKRQPAPECVSTIESCYHLIHEMQTAGIIDSGINPEPLMSVFKKMVNFQLEAEQKRIASGIPGRHDYDARRDTFRRNKNRRQNLAEEITTVESSPDDVAAGVPAPEDE